MWSIAATTTRFNPRSHTGSDAQEVFHQQRGDVSIHAPAWGATGRRSLCRGHRSVSTHAPTRGATRTFEKPTKANLFQSTLPHGERPVFTSLASAYGEFQSTLPHGERLHPGEWCQFCKVFQSTLPHGERRILTNLYGLTPEFQPTLPHGERRYDSTGILLVTESFNPRSRMGSDRDKA